MFNDLQKQSVGLVGANGFIGSAILHALIHRGVAPRALCGPIESPRPLPAGIDFVTCDLDDVERLQSWVSGLEVVIHAAGPPSVQRSFEMPEEYVRVHVGGTAAMLRACRMTKVNRLVYISSAEVYGRPEANPVAWRLSYSDLFPCMDHIFTPIHFFPELSQPPTVAVFAYGTSGRCGIIATLAIWQRRCCKPVALEMTNSESSTSAREWAQVSPISLSSCSGHWT
jgi:nucleoside-diphosphate-sugar epimerase